MGHRLFSLSVLCWNLFGICFGQSSTGNEYCQLSPERGPCKDSQKKWFFDKTNRNCTAFVYGGCLGNQNNFDTPEQCDMLCGESPRQSAAVRTLGQNSGLSAAVDDLRRRSQMLGGVARPNANVLLSDTSSRNECDQNVQRGFCSGFIPRWHYNGSSCELFYYSGCGGNTNNYQSRDSCRDRCEKQARSDAAITRMSPSPAELLGGCSARPQRGNCRSAVMRWYFDAEAQRCSEFVYSGCNGNNNNYASLRDCQLTCSRDSTVSDPATQLGAPDARQSPGSSVVDPGVNALIPLSKGRNLEPDQQADAAAKAADGVSSGRGRSLLPTGNAGGMGNTDLGLAAAVPERCQAEAERGPCTVDMERWYFDTRTSACRPFFYGGCLGNTNRFSSRKDCENTCGSQSEAIIMPNQAGGAGDICQLEKVTGSCRSAFRRYYFDSSLRQCREFTYGGCDGNENNFRSIEECEAQCQAESTGSRAGIEAGRTRSSSAGARPTGSGRNSLAPVIRCQVPPETGECRAALTRWFFDGQSCQTFTYGGCNGNDNNFESRELCQRECSASTSRTPFSNIPDSMTRSSGRTGLAAPTLDDTCQTMPDSGPCPGSLTRFFYDFNTGHCKAFLFGGCEGNLNNFRSVAECELACRARAFPRSANGSLPSVCAVPAQRGPCRAFIPSYFHDVRDGMCKMFYYGGCHGNENRFQSREECEGVCSTASNQITPFSSNPFGTRGGFESQFGNPAIDIGAGQGLKRKTSQFAYCVKECELVESPVPELCHNVTGDNCVKVCQFPAEPGNCLAMIPMFFFDRQLGQCRQFIYGGCGGNANRFTSLEECVATCPGIQTRRTADRADRMPVTFSAGKNPSCLMTKETGPCRGSFRQWAFEAAQQDCVQFVYGGCAGNENRFSTKEECRRQCGDLVEPDKANMMQMRLRQSSAAQQGQSFFGSQRARL